MGRYVGTGLATILCLIGLSAAVSVADTARDLDEQVEPMLAGLRANASALQTVRGTFEIRQTLIHPRLQADAALQSLSNPDAVDVRSPVPLDVEDKPFSYCIALLWGTDGLRSRADQDTPSYNCDNEQVVYCTQMAFDGQTVAEYCPDTMTVRMGMGVDYMNDHVFAAPPDFGLQWRGRTIREWVETGQARPVALEEIAGHECLRVDVEQDGRIKASFWLDPEIGYLARQVESYGKHGRVSTRMLLQSARRFEPGTWFPTGATREGFTYDPVTDEHLLIDRVEYSAASLSVNEPLPEDFFILKTPSGTRFEVLR